MAVAKKGRLEVLPTRTGPFGSLDQRDVEMFKQRKPDAVVVSNRHRAIMDDKMYLIVYVWIVWLFKDYREYRTPPISTVAPPKRWWR